MGSIVPIFSIYRLSGTFCRITQAPGIIPFVSENQEKSCEYLKSTKNNPLGCGPPWIPEQGIPVRLVHDLLFT